MTKNELIERIKKLLALSTDLSTTEHEKTLALKRAQALMAQHSIESIDLSDTKKIEELIITEDYTPKLENPLPSYLFNPGLMNAIIQPICNNFGCYASFYLHKPGQSIMGFKTNIEIAKYACDVLLNQGISDFRKQYKTIRSIGFATTFWNGFAEGLLIRFTKLSDETALVLYDKVKSKFNESIMSVAIEMPQSTEISGHSAGRKSATEATLNAGISSSRGGLLK